MSDSWTGLTQLTLVGRKTSKRIVVVLGEINEKTVDIQARSFIARTLGENECQAEGEAKVSHEKPQLDNPRKLRGNYFIDLEDKEVKENH